MALESQEIGPARTRLQRFYSGAKNVIREFIKISYEPPLPLPPFNPLIRRGLLPDSRTIVREEENLNIGEAYVILENSIRARGTENAPSRERRDMALGMAEHLDEYIKDLEASGEYSNGFRKTMLYFVTDAEYGMTPLERMAAIYESLDLAHVDDQTVRSHAYELVERAFDQHYENPEKYVSHGFDHSIKVADYIAEIADQSETGVLAGVMERYRVSAGEARFFLQFIALSHDRGYPHLEKWTKPYHGLPAIAMVMTTKIQMLTKGLISSDSDTEALIKDIGGAILYHNADKVEEEYPIKMITTIGEFLLKDQLGAREFSNFLDELVAQIHSIRTYRSGKPPKIAMPSFVVHDLKDIESLISNIGKVKKFMRLLGEELVMPEVYVVEGEAFKGRRIQSDHLREVGLGLEFRVGDSKDSPLLAAIRMADNMDASASRLSEIQRGRAFQEIYRKLGNGGPESLRLRELEARAKSGDILDFEAENTWKRLIIESILAKPEHAGRLAENPGMRDKIIEIAMGLNSGSLPHFGGCEVIERVSVKGATVVVKVNGSYEELNKIRVEEKSIDAEGKETKLEGGVGGCQIRRMLEAFQSIRINGQIPQVVVEI